MSKLNVLVAKLSLLILTFSVSIVPFWVSAATGDESCNKLGEQYKNVTGSDAPGVLVNNCYSLGGAITKAINIILTISAGLAVLFIIIGGFRYITSRGNETGSESAKKMMTWAIIGLILILLARTIVFIVTRYVIEGVT